MLKQIGRFLLVVGLIGIIIVTYLTFGGQVKTSQETTSLALVATSLCALLGQCIQGLQSTSQQEPIITEIFAKGRGPQEK